MALVDISSIEVLLVNQLVAVRVYVFVCNKSDPGGVFGRECQMTCNEPFGFFFMSIF